MLEPLINEYALPDDLRNTGHKCTDCKSPAIVYNVTVPDPGFQKGYYCFNCLVNHCRATHRIPLPMENELLARLEVALGLTKARNFYVIPRSLVPPGPG